MIVKKNYHWFSFILLLVVTFITPQDSIRGYIFGLLFASGVFISECMTRRRDENREDLILHISSTVGIDNVLNNIKKWEEGEEQA